MRPLLLTALLCASTVAHAAKPPPDEDTLPGVKAVQNRLQARTHELTLWVGSLPLDAFEKGLTVSGAYTVRLHDLVSWEVGQFTYSHGFETRLRSQLEELTVGPTPFETVDYLLTSSVVFTPFYGKSTVMNRAVVKHEAFLVAGAGVGWMSLSVRPAVDVGAGWRFWFDRRVSVRLDVRDVMLFAKGDLHNELWLGLGVGVGLGR